MTNTDISATELATLGGATNDGLKLGIIVSGTKAAQNDTITVNNAKAVLYACCLTDADGVSDPITISTNVMTLTSATATAGTIFLVYRQA